MKMLYRQTYFGLLGQNGGLYQEDDLYNLCSASNSPVFETKYVIVRRYCMFIFSPLESVTPLLRLSRKNRPRLSEYKMDQVEITQTGSPWQILYDFETTYEAEKLIIYNDTWIFLCPYVRNLMGPLPSCWQSQCHQ